MVYIVDSKGGFMQTAKLFKNGRSQAVRLPAEFRFEGDEVLIRRDPVTGDVILSPRNKKFEDWVKLRDRLLPDIPKEDLAALDDLRDKGPHIERDWP
jgi:antitoxin VapB